MRKINFLNIPIDAFTKQETFQKVENTILLKKQIHHTVVNSGKIVLMQTDKGLAKSIVESDIINADGQSIVWAAKLLVKKLPERVSGLDLMQELVKRSFKNGYKCFFFRATEEIFTKLLGTYKKQYSENIIA